MKLSKDFKSKMSAVFMKILSTLDWFANRSVKHKQPVLLPAILVFWTNTLLLTRKMKAFTSCSTAPSMAFISTRTRPSDIFLWKFIALSPIWCTIGQTIARSKKFRGKTSKNFTTWTSFDSSATWSKKFRATPSWTFRCCVLLLLVSWFCHDRFCK